MLALLVLWQRLALCIGCACLIQTIMVMLYVQICWCWLLHLEFRLQICEVGAQLNQDMFGSNQIYHYVLGGHVALMDLTDQNSDPPDIQNLRAHQVLDEMPKSVLVDFAVDSN